MTLHFHLSISLFKKIMKLLTCDIVGEGKGELKKNYTDLIISVTTIYLLKFKNTYILGISVTMQHYRNDDTFHGCH